MTLFAIAGAGTAMAQTATWNGSVNNLWGTANNWTPNVVPNSSSANVVITSATNNPVVLNIDPTIGSLTIGASNSLGISNNTVLAVGSSISNAGTISLDSVGNDTELRLAAGATVSLTGGGTVSLSNNANNLIRDPFAGTGQLINVNNLIEGSGNIGNAQMSLDNQAGGVINANQSTPLILQPNGSGFSNEGLMEATSGGTLALDGGTFTNSNLITTDSGQGSALLVENGAVVNGGTVTVQSGSSLTLGNGTITGGVLNLNSGTTTQTVSGTGNNGLGGTVNNAGALTVTNNSDLVLQNGTVVSNTGTISLGSVGNDTELRLAAGATATLTGGGTVSLSNNANNLIRDPFAGSGHLINVNNLIEGSGNIGNAQMSIDNQAGGVINANQSTALILQPNGSGFSNEGTLEATSGGTLQLNGTYATPGTIQALGAGSAVVLESGTILNAQGGTLTTTGGGVIETASGTQSTINGSSGVTLTSGTQLLVQNNSDLVLSGTIINGGTISVDSAGNGTELRLAAGSTVSLTGGGTVSLSNNANNLIRDPFAGTGQLINVNNLIEGSGNIGASQMSLDNQAGGVINANQSTPLILQPNGSGFSNEGLMEATSGGTLALDGGTFTNSNLITTDSGQGSALLVENGAVVNGGTVTVQSGSSLTLGNGTIAGGVLNLNGGAVAQTVSGTGSNGLGGTVNNAGALTVTNNSDLVLQNGTIINNTGTMSLDSAGNTTELRLAAGATATLTGGGTVSLSNNANNLIRDPFAGSGHLINVNNLIEGSGNIGAGQMSLDNQAGGVIDANQSTPLVLQPNGSGVTNEGLMEATSGGTLQLNGTYTTPGTIQALGTGSAVVLESGAILNAQGGTLTTATGGVIETASGTQSTINGGSGVTLTSGSQLLIQNNSDLVLSGMIINGGTISVDSSGNTTELRLAAGSTVSLTGGGTVSLSNNANNLIRDPFAGSGHLINVNNLIEGSGNIGASQMSLDNQAGGVINANQSTPLILQPNGSGFSNEGLMEATNGGTLNLLGTFANTSTIQAIGSGSAVVLGSGTILNSDGGTLTTTGGGVIETTSGTQSTINGGSGVTLTSGTQILVQNNSDLVVSGTIINGGTISVDSAGNGTELRLAAGATATLTGGGTVSLSNNTNNLIRDPFAGSGHLINVNNLIEGSGNIGAGQMSLDNQAGGTIAANFAGSALLIDTNSAGVSNEGTFIATNGGQLTVEGGPFTNYSNTSNTLTGGTYLVDANSTFTFTNANIVTNAATIRLSGANSNIQDQNGHDALANFTTNAAAGNFTIQNGRNLTTPGAFSNAGNVTVGSGSTFTVGAGAAYTQSGGTTQVDGTLAAPNVFINSGLLDGNGTVNGNVTNTGGTVRGGDPPGILSITGDYNQGVGGAFDVLVGGLTPGDGSGHYGELLVDNQASLAGALNVDTYGGFAFATGDTYSFDILGTGQGLTNDLTALNFDGNSCAASGTDQWTCNFSSFFDVFTEVTLDNNTLLGGADSQDLVLDVAQVSSTPPPPPGVPEPGTLVLLGSGIAAMVARLRRRQRL